MRQVLFYIPILDWPVYGYGFMLFCAFIACTWLATRLARREGVPKEPITDLAVWLFVTGIIGARVTFIIQNWGTFDSFGSYFAVWDNGGLVFYGSIFGAIVGYLFSYHLQLKKYGVSHWKMLDIVAPCLALGLCLGRLGCLLNGCCYGNVACGDCLAMEFPMSSPPGANMVERRYQTPTGFLTFGRRTVRVVEPSSAAANAGLLPNDMIEKVNGHPVKDDAAIEAARALHLKRGEHALELEVSSPTGATRNVGPFAPHTLGLHPTQVYESISTALMLFLLVSLYPYKTRDGVLMVIFMFAYGIHRFLNEMLRIDNEIVAFGMTFSQNVSIAVLIAGAVLGILVWRRPTTIASNPAEPATETTAALEAPCPPAATTAS